MMQRRIALAAAAALFAGTLCGAPPEAPKTPAGMRFQQWLDAFNSGDKAKIQAFHVDAMPKEAGETPEQMTDMVLGFHKQTGGFEVVALTAPDAHHLTATLKEKNSGSGARLELEVEPAPPHKVANIGIMPEGEGRREGGPPPERMTQDAALAALKEEAEKQSQEGRFSGAVLVGKNGTVLWKDAYGQADRASNTANRTDTKFNLGSMNKMFTAVAIAQLVEEGKVRFDDPVGKHLTDYPNKDVAAKVTIHHLLTHTGGTGDIFGPAFHKNLASLKSPQDYVAIYGQRAPAFEPGARHVYSNYGFVLLGAIVEKVSGKSYYDYVAARIFAPAGMKDTASYWKDEKIANMATGYMRERGEVRDNYATRPMRGSPAGGGYSTVEDLFRFASALLNHKLLNAELTRTITKGKVEAGRGGIRYGYGFMDARQNGVHWVGHGGGAPGINADLRIFPESGYVVAVGANLDPPAAQRISGYISDRLPAK